MEKGVLKDAFIFEIISLSTANRVRKDVDLNKNSHVPQYMYFPPNVLPRMPRDAAVQRYSNSVTPSDEVLACQKKCQKNQACSCAHSWLDPTSVMTPGTLPGPNFLLLVLCRRCV